MFVQLLWQQVFANKCLSPACSQELHRTSGHVLEYTSWHYFNTIAVLLNVLLLCSVEYNMSYAYHAVSSYFNRDNVALPGFVSYFRDASIEERDHAQMLMDFQVT